MASTSQIDAATIRRAYPFAARCELGHHWRVVRDMPEEDVGHAGEVWGEIDFAHPRACGVGIRWRDTGAEADGEVAGGGFVVGDIDGAFLDRCVIDGVHLYGDE